MGCVEGRLGAFAPIRNNSVTAPRYPLIGEGPISSFLPVHLAPGAHPMKTVCLLRHAKSSWEEPHLADFLRPLAPRGRKAAPRMGAYMARSGLVPDHVLCSAARRAVDTWSLVAPFLGDNVVVETREDLYHASPEGIMAILGTLPASEESVLVVGHNPTFEELALALAGDGEEKALAALRRKYPTGALAVLEFSRGIWAGIHSGAGYLRRFVRPKDLKS